MTNKAAKTSKAIHPLLAQRFSPRGFREDREIQESDIISILEAGRWAASCFNDQPWRFLLFPRSGNMESRKKAESCLMEGNAWACRASLLMITFSLDLFRHNAKPNRHAKHDLGLSVAQMVLQAEALGIKAHQMAGFDLERVRNIFHVPSSWTPMTMIAFGYQGGFEKLSQKHQEQEVAPRERLSLEELAFAGDLKSPWLSQS